MPEKEASTPRVFLVRHGQTEWSQSGQYTGKTDIPLTTDGEQQVLATSKLVAGSKRLMDPSKLARVFISPRQRAQKTFKLLFGEDACDALQSEGKVETTENVAEWDYGAYEGLLTKQIREKRKADGYDIDRDWDIWRDGCEEGESAQQVSNRIDKVIEKIHEIHGPHMKDGVDCDILVVAHGHLLRAFAKRWLRYRLHNPLSLMLEPGGVGILSYQHHNIEEPALLLGIGFPTEE